MDSKGLCNISNTRKSVSSGYPNPEKWVEKTRRSRVFLTDFEVFEYLIKHCFEFLIWLLKPFVILGELQNKVRKIVC